MKESKGQPMRFFGTDGVRGIANQLPMTSELAMQLGRATAHLLFERRPSEMSPPPKVVIGKDTRLSGYMLENALAAGFCSMGAQVFLVGPLPTPGIAFITRSMRADVGVVISASHNSFEYNGIKIFDRHGYKLPDAKEAQIESLMHSEELNGVRPTMENIGRAKRIDDAIGRYIVFIKGVLPHATSLENVRVVLDCANGAAYKVGPIILSELGAEVFPFHCAPNGRNINDQCGAVFPATMARAVHEHRAEIGIALDGDADRVILSDEKGDLVDGDQILAICALHMAEKGTLRDNTVVVTPMTNMGVRLGLERSGVKLVEAKVGDRYIVEMMRSLNLNLGGEQSGHIVFLDHNTTGDGLMAALKVLSIMKETGKTLSELRSQVQVFPQVLMNVPVREKTDLALVPDISAAIAKAEKTLGTQGRVLVRYSGTEPLARIMVEGREGGEIGALAEEIAQNIRLKLG